MLDSFFYSIIRNILFIIKRRVKYPFQERDQMKWVIFNFNSIERLSHRWLVKLEWKMDYSSRNIKHFEALILKGQTKSIMIMLGNSTLKRICKPSYLKWSYSQQVCYSKFLQLLDTHLSIQMDPKNMKNHSKNSPRWYPAKSSSYHVERSKHLSSNHWFIPN